MNYGRGGLTNRSQAVPDQLRVCTGGISGIFLELICGGWGNDADTLGVGGEDAVCGTVTPLAPFTNATALPFSSRKNLCEKLPR
jgi:hypothetical protein